MNHLPMSKVQCRGAIPILWSTTHCRLPLSRSLTTPFLQPTPSPEAHLLERSTKWLLPPRLWPAQCRARCSPPLSADCPMATDPHPPPHTFMDLRTLAPTRYPLQVGTNGALARACMNPTVRRRTMTGANLWGVRSVRRNTLKKITKTELWARAMTAKGNHDDFFLLCSVIPLLYHVICLMDGGYVYGKVVRK